MAKRSRARDPYPDTDALRYRVSRPWGWVRGVDLFALEPLERGLKTQRGWTVRVHDANDRGQILVSFTAARYYVKNKPDGASILMVGRERFKTGFLYEPWTGEIPSVSVSWNGKPVKGVLPEDEMLFVEHLFPRAMKAYNEGLGSEGARRNPRRAARARRNPSTGTLHWGYGTAGVVALKQSGAFDVGMKAIVQLTQLEQQGATLVTVFDTELQTAVVGYIDPATGVTRVVYMSDGMHEFAERLLAMHRRGALPSYEAGFFLANRVDGASRRYRQASSPYGHEVSADEAQARGLNDVYPDEIAAAIVRGFASLPRGNPRRRGAGS